jgi:AraC family transcriptional regulator
MIKEDSIKTYYFRINKCIDYIKSHLHTSLNLEVLAQQSSFSKYHFHRVFKQVTGYTVNEFIRNARIERSCFYLLHYPLKPITEVAYECGFTSAVSFSRSFKEVHYISATEWRQAQLNSKIGKVNSNLSKGEEMIQGYLASKIEYMTNSLMPPNPQLNVEVKQMQNFKIAFIRNLNVHQHDSETFEKMFDTLFAWAGPRNLLNFPETKALTVYRSNPNASGIIQADVCVSVPEDIIGDGIVGTTEITGGLYAVIYKERTIEECYGSWQYLFNLWLPANGYQPDNRNFYISHLNDPKSHPKHHHIFELYVPVKPL